MTDPVNLIDRQTQLANFLVAGWPKLAIPGISPVGAAAAVGNATQENSCRSVTTGAKDHGSDGLFQWRLDRLTNMQAFGVKWFGAWDSIEAQAAFFSFECKGDYPALWNDLVVGSKALATLTLNICDQYERPSAAGRVPDQRIGYATTFYAKWVPLPPLPAAPTPAPAPVTPSLPPSGALLMDPAILAQLAPLIEALAAGLFRALLAQLSAAPGAASAGAPAAAVPPVAPAAPLDLGSLVSALAPLLTQQLAGALPSLIAAEVAKLNPGAKP